MRRPFWKPWSAEIVGLWSGIHQPMPFCRFWTEQAAQNFCDRQNNHPWVDVTEWHPVDLRERKDSARVRS